MECVDNLCKRRRRGKTLAGRGGGGNLHVHAHDTYRFLPSLLDATVHVQRLARCPLLPMGLTGLAHLASGLSDGGMSLLKQKVCPQTRHSPKPFWGINAFIAYTDFSP